ncbi:histidinol dehydrogenase [Alicyclobacillus cellulosilyticus]|uniref:Histidinol dehydrogenase n=1 Tax=Alicyclobacillus cellulosilyticus TaxID=1003997 RepID=A0A917NHQ4_9BACL|nr:histidinol dehydrogenase [Alicyclobacillus cellulosilyticus]GGJ01549.1 histidinol dehydrogenase [Alicyclobacillus cellulosilyticus]
MKLRRVRARDWDWRRTPSSDPLARAAVEEMVAAVRQEGERAVRRLTAEHDCRPEALAPAWSFAVPRERLQAAWEALPETLREALRAAADRIRRFHEAQKPQDVELAGTDGERLGMVWRPVPRVGVYAPGGRAAYPSSVLMNLIPAQVAGVPELVLVSPPSGPDGFPHPLVLAAAYLAGVTQVYRVGGAQAIAALAYGAGEIPKVDKVVGPGNLYVALAKRVVMGDVGIDSIAGPSEVFVVADETANPAWVAADLLAQAEHDAEAGAVLVTTAPGLADAVEAELARQLADLPRRELAAKALADWGAVVLAERWEEAVAVVNRSAPEHVELHVAEPRRWLAAIDCAGAVFLGPYTPEPVGDYYAGPNHILPTHGSARYASGLSVYDFLRRITYAEYTAETLVRHTGHVTALARAEGLEAHARAVEIRRQGGGAR